MRLALLVLLASSAAAQPDGLLGRWAGAAVQNGTPVLFELDLSRGADGALATSLTLPYNGYDRFAFDFAYAPAASGDAASGDGTLTGGLFGDEMHLTVDLAEGHLRGTVTAGDSVTARVHLQKVVGFPLPAIADEEVRFAVGRDTLAGTLYRPAGAVRPPAAVVVAGRDAGTRAAMSGWARLLARTGTAALVYDAHGTGRSTGDAHTETAEDRIDGARAALDLLLARDDLGAVGLVGYSAAGWIVPTVAADRDDVAFVVTMAGPTESLADQQGHVTTAFMRASETPFTDAETAAAFAYQRQTVVLAQAGASWDEFEAVNAPARATRWAEHALIPDSLGAPDLDYFRRRTGFAAPPWSRVRAPVLAFFGEADPIVPPGDNVPRLLAAQPGATVVVLPGADHTLARPAAVVGEGAWPERFYRPWTRSALLFETLVRWVGERATAP